MNHEEPTAGHLDPEKSELSFPFYSIVAILSRNWKSVAACSLAGGITGYAFSKILPPTFTAQAVIISPQQQNTVTAALGSLGPLAGIAGASIGARSPADQYVALMSSARISDKILDKFNLMEAYETKYKSEARSTLSKNTNITAGKKDGLITIIVSDHNAQRAADIANSYVDELKQLTNTLALSEAQQRRLFFEKQLKETKENLTQAQIELQSTGFSSSAVSADAKTTAEVYTRLRAELIAAEIKLQATSITMTRESPDFRQHEALTLALRDQVRKLEKPTISPPNKNASEDYITKYRNYKYQEAIFEVFSRQFEAAKSDESREGVLIQIVDLASPPELKSKPNRLLITIVSSIGGALIGALAIIKRQRRKHTQATNA